MKRIIFFLATNLAIVLVLSLTMRLLGVEPYLNENGLNLGSLLIFAAVMGFGGSFISLAISKWMAKKTMGVRVIDAPSSTTEFWLKRCANTRRMRASRCRKSVFSTRPRSTPSPPA
jgi:heat shock protein HtpX